MILSRIDVRVTAYQSTIDEFLDQLSGICNVFAIYFPVLNRAIKLNKK